MTGDEKVGAAPRAVRAGHLLRIGGYLDMAILAMWTVNPRADLIMGMAEASTRGKGPKPDDEALLRRLHALISEAREYRDADDFPAAMARMRVADDLVSLAVIRLTGE